MVADVRSYLSCFAMVADAICPQPTAVVSTNSHKHKDDELQRTIARQQRRIDSLFKYVQKLMPWTSFVSERALAQWGKCAIDHEDGEEDSLQGN